MRGALRTVRGCAAAIAVSSFFLLSSLTRVTLAVSEGLHRSLPAANMVRAFLAGTLLDLEAALWLAAPFVAVLAIAPNRWLRSRVCRAVLAGSLAVAFGFALFVAVAEVFFFQEFDGRFNFVAVDYLIYPTEVVENIWQSYHTGAVLGCVAILSAAAFLSFHRLFRRLPGDATSRGRRAACAVAFAGAMASVTVAVPSDLFRVGPDRAVNEIASNGYLSFWSALLGQDAPFEGLYRTDSLEADVARLRRLLSERATKDSSFASGSTLRHVRPLRKPRRANVVLVLEESLGSEFVGALHDGAPSLTPELDALVPKGTFLTHAYSTGNRTIRALEATTASIPPLPGVSIVRRKGSRGLFTLPEVLRARGYRTLFVYGGRAFFDGMGRYMRANGVERVVDQADFPRTAFRTAWGICDEAIFDRALVEMDALHGAGETFYAIVLTVSNHRPFLYPRGRIEPDPGQGRRVNAVRYADYALGRFVREAARHPFFDDTLFVLMGDHGPRVYGAAEIPMASYEIPIIFYGPKLVEAGVEIRTLASSMDVPPTILGLLGLEYDTKFFGRDVFALDPSEGRAPMTHNTEIALLEGDRLAVLGLHGSADLYRYGRAEETLTPLPDRAPASRAAIADAIAYFDGADKLYRGGGYQFVPDASAQILPVRGPQPPPIPEAAGRKKG